MKKLIGLLIVFWPLLIRAQGENNIWAFSEVGGAGIKVINFNSSPPGISTSFITSSNYLDVYSSVVCYPSGQLRFYVRLTEYAPWGPPQMNIFKADGTPIPNSNLYCGIMNEGAQPVVIPHPGNLDQYYIFYAYSRGILYSLLDMSINGGNGGIVAGQKDVVLAPYGTVISQKMVPVIGCDGVWLVIRSRIMNGYYSYHITHNGIDTSAVESHAGLFSHYDDMGFIKASPDGRLLALSSYFGLELYTFEKCSGRLKNFGIIDSTHNALPYTQSFYNNERFTGVGFSPDNSKLYATYNGNHPILTGFTTDSGKLYQYDVSILNLPFISASKALVLTNIHSIIGDINSCLAHTPNPLGEIKTGPDGKLYIDNGSTTCRTPGNVPPGFNPGPGFHCLHFPNLSGPACGPELNVLDASFPNYYGGDFYKGGEGGASYLQQEIIIAPLSPDTVAGTTRSIFFCFMDTGKVCANEDGACFTWDDNTGDRCRKVYDDGLYYVRYFKGCSVTTDTFYVSMVEAPVLISSKACPGMFTGTLIATVPTEANLSFKFTWLSEDGSILRQQENKTSDTITGLNTGKYSVTISGNGCDTTLVAMVENYPAASIAVHPSLATINYGDSITLHATGGLLYVWSPSGSLDTTTSPNPVARPLQPTEYMVIGFNEYGCRDTGYVRIDVDYNMNEMIPNAFSPNGDGLNDIFRIEGIKYQRINQFSIFNRYGQPVFSSTDPGAGWNGMQNGRPCDAGTYFYSITLSYPNGKTKTYKGDLLLIR